jgi:signal transduction histidine kinase
MRHGRLQSPLPGGEDEVGEVAGALRGMADRVGQQLALQRSLLAAVSHELRSPLARVRVMVELAREGHAPAGIYDDLQAEVDGMDALVADLLAASRIDFEAVAPRALPVRDVASRALALAGLGDARLEGDVDGVVRADPTLLDRALGAVLDNARKHGGGEVRLRVRRGDGVRFEVEDDGPGFGPGEEAAVFQPFWRRPPKAGEVRPRGEGLGLALVRQIAEAHGGAAGAENRPEGGARVWVELPS